MKPKFNNHSLNGKVIYRRGNKKAKTDAERILDNRRVEFSNKCINDRSGIMES